ncbi:MAG: hypothetical protein IIC81_01670 [Chloroflexi bacterium]|nr:hypothetical protein [Chloroflexota bacterium]
MRKMSIVLMMAILFATVGIYAASVTGSTKTLGGTGSVTVSAPATSAAVSWTVDASGDVTAVTVAWTPGLAGDYTLNVTVDASSGTFSCTTCGTSPRSDSVTISPVVPADTVTAASVQIFED